MQLGCVCQYGTPISQIKTRMSAIADKTNAGCYIGDSAKTIPQKAEDGGILYAPSAEQRRAPFLYNYAESRTMKKSLAIIIAAAAVAGSGLAWKLSKKEAAPLAANFQECAAAGNPVMESYPRQCRSGGRTFIEDIGNGLEKTDLIRLDTPRPGQVIRSPLAITGEARGSWFFEASFPVVLTDWDGLIIAEGIATAKGDWMTADFVPFTAELTFTVNKNAYSNKGTLVLRKDNPSGLPEHDDALEIPVVFGKADDSDGTGIAPATSGVRGTVLLGPVCPVMKNPPEPGCDDQPFETTVQVFAKNAADNSPFAVTQTDNNGQYAFALPPGEYTLQAASGKPFPRCAAKDVTVDPDTTTEVHLSCDTGIR